MERFTFTIGKSCKSVNWVLSAKSWPEFCQRCMEPVRTKERFDVYMRMNRDSQAAIKDVGGFVAATLSGPRRRRDAVINRTAVTLDLDECGSTSPAQVWAMIRETMPTVAALVYTTHKHCAERARMRVVIPLRCALARDAYEPVARMCAKYIGILDMCDSTTFDPCRLFYWPSCSKDAEFWANWCDGDGLDALSLLGMYNDWKDATEWPMVPGEDEHTKERLQRRAGGGHLADPLTKPGIVGVFCRTYSPIQQGIETLLSDVYTRGTGGRYSYIGGQSANGLVIYDNDEGVGCWAYSNHASDPATGEACNIFDLVRIHRYGHLDEGSAAKGERLPSFKAMLEHAQNDNGVKAQIYREHMADFDGIDLSAYVDKPTENGANPTGSDRKSDNGRADETAALEDLDWTSALKVNTKTGEYYPSIDNIIAILELDPLLKDMIGYNTMTGRTVKRRAPFWGSAGNWSDADDACLRVYFEKVYKIVAKEKIYDAVVHVEQKNRFHPIRDYLTALPPWDPQRPTLVERVFIDYLGAEDSALNRAISRKFFTACVARVMEPGCKFDYCLTLMGPEGIGKSTIFRRLASDEYFTDSVYTLEGKDFMEQIQPYWICELSELAATSRSGLERIKQVLTQQSDSFRAAYGRRVDEHKRQCVIVATTNEENPLKGDTGNRRFWLLPVSATTCAIGDLGTLRDDIWAEALWLYRQGEPLCLDREMEAQMRERQRERNINVDDPMPAMLEDFLEAELPADWRVNWDLYRRRRFWQGNESVDFATEPRVCFSACEFICERLCRDMNDREYSALSRKVSALMKEHPEWVRSTSVSGHSYNIYGRQKCWVRVKKTGSS